MIHIAEDWTLVDEQGSFLAQHLCRKPWNRLVFWPTPRNSISGICYAMTGIFEKMHSADDYLAYLKQFYPHLPEQWYSSIAAQLMVWRCLLDVYVFVYASRVRV